jgi:UDP-N-acetylmuramoyl-tripeptide--D-alanyl-D-alanine ligase
MLDLSQLRKLTRRQKLLIPALVLPLILAFSWWQWGERFYLRWLFESPSAGRCDKRLNRDLLSRSIKLGTNYVLAHQTSDGNFDYEYDWRSDELSEDDHETRQAGALWGLTLLYQDPDQHRPEVRAAIERGLTYFNDHSRLVKGARCTTYPTSQLGHSGTVALIALAHVEYLRGAPDLPAASREQLQKSLDEYVTMLVRSVSPNGLWYGDYDLKNCKPKGAPSPYSDGEALLALVKAAKYAGHTELLPDIMAAAAAGKRFNIDEALAAEADSDTTKGYYQWSSMAFYELATSDFPNTKIYGDTLIRLADWVIDTHHILTRTRNTGYAYEGIVPAFALAKQRHDGVHQAKFGCIIDLGLERIMTWQVGGPLTNRYTASVSAGDTKAIGGVQNAAFEAPLRIDVTQHQMHATQLARQYVY